jgi:photosystem II stability/assembly factor-like uncharacterized protein
MKAKWIWIVLLLGILIGGTILLLNTEDDDQVYLHDVHGLAYSINGSSILIPSHYGIVSYADGKWMNPVWEEHDFMGFSKVDNGFYSSGHPAEGSSLKNPLGLVKSTDEGKTIEILTLHGEVDFHVMSASYESHTVYVWNDRPNSQIGEVGIFYTKDDGKTWTKGEGTGIEAVPINIAVHPTNDSIVAVGTETGLYLSKDYGNQFEKVVSDAHITSLHFNVTGDLYIGGYDTKPWLQKMNVESKQTNELALPTLTEDAVAYIAENPKMEEEVTIATFKKDVYVSKDSGQTWTQIAKEGNGL